MIVDTSALLAIIKGEPERAGFVSTLAEASEIEMSVASYVELCAVVDRLGDPVLSRRIDELLGELGVELAPVTADHARIARAAYRDFGRGSGHRAGLNFGDVFAYALARSTGRPLLFKGDDFTETDVRRADGEPPAITG